MTRTLLAALAACVLASHGGTVQAAAMNNGWESITITQEQCANAAAEAVQRVGFAMQRDGNGAWGFRPNDGVTVRCVAQRQLAIFFVYLGQGQAPEARALLDQLRTAFTAAAPARTAPAR